MSGIERLNSRQKRMLNKVLQELDCAMSVPDALLMLETNYATKTLLDNPDLQPIAFAIKHPTRRSYVYGVLGEILAWVILALSILLVSLAFIIIIALALAAVFTWNFGLVRVIKYIPTLLERSQQIKYRFTHHRWVAGRRRYNAYKRLITDKRPPVLYLRSFSFDTVYELPMEDTRRADERLAEYYELVGPVIAVAGPDDKGYMLGPVRLYFNDDIWHAGVTYLMSISQLVIIQAGISQGTLWELGMARRMLEPEKLILSVADASDPSVVDSYYYDFKPYAEAIMGCELPRRLGSNVHIGFGEKWEPVLLGSGGGLFPVKTSGRHSNQQETCEVSGTKASTTQTYETKYKKCLDCGLGNWHEAVTCERCGKVLESIYPLPEWIN